MQYKRRDEGLLHVLTREVNVEISKYKSSKWQEFLSKVQESHVNTKSLLAASFQGI